MITIFNRKELTITYSMEEQAKVRALLATNHIDYKIKVVNRNSPSAFSDTRARTGILGQNMAIAYEYIFFVHRNEFEMAQSIMAGQYLK